MKTTYLDNEIILLEGYKKEGTASFYQLRKLAEYREIKQLIIGGVSHCACTPDETTGTTTVRCCNICGKPAESFWHCG